MAEKLLPTFGQGIGNDALQQVNVPDVVALDNILQHHRVENILKVVLTDLRLEVDAGQEGHTAILDVLLESQCRVSYWNSVKEKGYTTKKIYPPSDCRSPAHRTASESWI